VTVIDGATNQVLTTISVGSEPIALVWNSIQNRTYVANHYSSSISVIRDSIISGIEETTNPNAISLTPEIYPNPAKGVMLVRVPWSIVGRVSQPRLKIFNVSGKLIKEIASPPMADRNDKVGDMKISLKGISPGIYFLKVGKETKKFLVLK